MYLYHAIIFHAILSYIPVKKSMPTRGWIRDIVCKGRIKMTRFKFNSWCIALAVTLGVFSSAALAAENKKELTFVTISTEEMAAMAARWEPTIKYIQEKAGVKINYYATTSYAAAVEALLNDFADFGMLGPKIYLVARQKSDKIDPIVGTGRPPNHYLKESCACYHGRLITKKGSKFTTI